MSEKADTVSSASDSTPVPDHFPVPEALLSTWDACFQDLWSARLTTALAAAEMLLAPEALFALEKTDARLPHAAETMATVFWRALNQRYPAMPDSAEARYRALVIAIWATLRALRKTSAGPADYAQVIVLLRPVRRMRASSLVGEVCDVLYDYHRGMWPLLTASQKYLFEAVLGRTLASFPAQDLQPLWNGLQDLNPLWRQAMLLGMRLLRAQYAVPHLLYGLEFNQDHTVRSTIVDYLEELADPTSIALLTRLHHETAADDWTLSRHIARVLKVIERQNRGQMHRVLLRPAAMPSDSGKGLLRPAAPSQTTEETNVLLLRPTAQESQNEPQEKEDFSPPPPYES